MDNSPKDSATPFTAPSSGLRILYVHPRLIGSIKDWSGLESENQQSWLLDHTAEMGFNAIWFSPLTEASNVKFNDHHGAACTGSMYALRDHKNLDAATRVDPDKPSPEKDDQHLRAFLADAKKRNVAVMADLVFNHVAADHTLVTEETTKIEQVKSSGHHWWINRADNGAPIGLSWHDDAGAQQNLPFKFSRNNDLQVLNFSGGTGYDTAQINYNSPHARTFFVDGENGKLGYWKQVIDNHIDEGFTGFRCDIAYKLPADWWRDIIQHAENRSPDMLFMAETLGDDGRANGLRDARITNRKTGAVEPAFDHAMLGLYWWNMKDGWILHENDRLQGVSRFGGAGFPDNHDTHKTIAQHFMEHFNYMADKGARDKLVSDICLRNYAVAALLCNSVYMQMGYEYCRDQVSVFRDPAYPQYWKDLVAERGAPEHPLNLTKRIRAINDFKASLNNAHAIVHIENVCNAGPDNRLLKMSCALIDEKTRAPVGRMVVYVNEQPENGAVCIQNEEVLAETQAPMRRLILGPKDKAEAETHKIRDIAAFYTPFDQTTPLAVAPTPVCAR